MPIMTTNDMAVMLPMNDDVVRLLADDRCEVLLSGGGQQPQWVRLNTKQTVRQ